MNKSMNHVGTTNVLENGIGINGCVKTNQASREEQMYESCRKEIIACSKDRWTSQASAIGRDL